MEIQLGILIFQSLIKYGPEVAEAITLAIHKKDPTAEDYLSVIRQAKSVAQNFADETKIS